MHLHLLIPALLRPPLYVDHARYGPAANTLPRLEALELLLARGRRRAHEDADATAWLCGVHGIARQADWPVAPIALLADGGQPGNGFWLRADPVHLRLQGDHLLLADASLLALSREEASALADSLNQHFAGDGFSLHALQSDRWYAQLAAVPGITTTPLAHAAGQSVDENLPRGADAPAWHARLNEVQMLLHDHPVNAAREAHGAMPVNSLWFWGGGVLPVEQEPSVENPRPFNRVWAGDAFARGLAAACGATAHALPESATALLAAAPQQGVGLVVLDALAAPLAYGDIGAWEARLLELEAAWFTPLVAALRAQRIGMLTLHGFGPTGAGEPGGFALETARQDLARFWRRPKPLSKQLV